MNKRIFLPAPVRLFSCSEMDEYDADGVISPNGNGSLSQNVQSSMKWSEIYAGLFSKELDRPHIMVSGHHGRQGSQSFYRKQAALGNQRASSHCAHWHCF